MNKIKIFNKEIEVTTKNCKLFGQESESYPRVNLYVVTKNCNADCQFCTYKNYANNWNGKKFKNILENLVDKVIINKIGVSGGEPTLNWDNFLEITNISKEISPKSELSLNTNGFNLDKLFTEIYKKYDFINLSRHHYNDHINNKIFRYESTKSDELKKFAKKQTHPHQLQFRCNLINGFIDNKEEIYKFIDWSNSIGVYDIGLISLMKVNDFCKDNFVKFEIDCLKNDNFFLTKKFEYCKGGCECFNWIYIPENEFKIPVHVYHKNTFIPELQTQILTYDGEFLKSGFGGEIII